MEKNLHKKMESAWTHMKLLKESLTFETSDLECSFGNYVTIENEWKKQNYPIPTFNIKGIGEVGFDYDKFYLVIPVEKTSITKEFIKNLLDATYTISIYGDKNFLTELCTTKDATKVFQNIKAHDENIIQIEFNFSENDIKNFQNVVEKICTLFKEY
ncbi:MAG: DUF3201 domain-containing protein [Candidatus Methanofastidiosia archaeon]|jgi:hypothetical protein